MTRGKDEPCSLWQIEIMWNLMLTQRFRRDPRRNQRVKKCCLTNAQEQCGNPQLFFNQLNTHSFRALRALNDALCPQTSAAGGKFVAETILQICLRKSTAAA